MTDLTIRIGVDPGNSACKVVTPDDAFLIPTIVDRVAAVTVWSDPHDPLAHLDFGILSSDFAPIGRALYGRLAVETGNGQEMPLRARKLDSEAMRMSLLMAIAAAVCRRLDAMNHEAKALVKTARAAHRTLRIDVKVGLGLPLSEFQNKEERRAFRQQLRGKHLVQFHSTPRWQEYGAMELDLSHVEIFPEGLPILYHLVFDKDGKVIRPDLAKGHVLINDIGAGTHDMPYFVDMKLSNAWTMHHPSQVADHLDAIVSQANALYNRRLTRLDLTGFMFADGLRHTIPDGNSQINIEQITRPRLEALANSVGSRTSRSFQVSNGQLTCVIMAGGASALIRDTFEHALTRNGFPDRTPFSIIWPENGQMANANGYLKMLQDRLMSDVAVSASSGAGA